MRAPFSVLLLCSLAVGASAAVYTVPSQSIFTIGQALHLTHGGDVVVVLAGTYHERNLSVPAGVTLRAASGDEGLVIVDGSGLGRVLLTIEAGSAAVIEDLVVRGGLADKGGGLLCSNNSPVVRRVRFEGNTADYGGGLYVTGYAQPHLEDCDFVGNVSRSVGGGALLTGDSHAVLTGCLFDANEAATAGGGFCVSSGAVVDLDRCTLVANVAPHGAGSSAWRAGAIQALNCLVAANEGRSFAGDIGSIPTFHCSDLALNTGGDWVGGLIYQAAGNGNFSLDPLFCGAVHPQEPWSLDAASPCAGGNQPGCGLVGARPVGCSSGTGLEPQLPDPDGTVILATRLYPCRPNPFNPSTTLRFDLHRPGRAALEVFDTRGRLVATLFSGGLEVGTHDFTWHGRDAAGRAASTGVYFARLTTATHVETKRMMLIK
jgi:hypothetical protein